MRLISAPIINGIETTFILTIVAFMGGILLGSVIALLLMSKNKSIYYLAKIYVNLIRATPLVLILLGCFLIFPNLFGNSQRLITAMIAFVLFEAAYFAEIIRAGISGISTGQKYASRLLGLNLYQTYRYIILPQAIHAMIPVVLLQMIIIFQDTSIVYIIGLNDFFTSAYNQGEVTGELAFYIVSAGLVYWLISFSANYLIQRMWRRSC